jgi:hypothetical protein
LVAQFPGRLEPLVKHVPPSEGVDS